VAKRNDKMAYRRLGRTGMEVSVIGIGTILIGGRISREEGAAVVGRGLDLGCSFIDTAHCYGKGESELAVGDAIAGRAREDAVILTRSERRAAADFEEDIGTSLERMRTDYIDVHQIHDVTSPELYEQIKAEGLPEIQQRAKQEGRLRATGISSHGSPELLCEMARSGLFDVITFAYNLLGHKRQAGDFDVHARTRDEVLPVMAEHDVGVTVMKPLGGGVLTRPSEKLLSLMAERPVTNAVSALLFAVADPRIHTAAPGVATVAEIEEDVRAGDPAQALSPKEREELIAEAAKWGEGLCHYCGYCTPCSEEIRIFDVLRFEGYFRRYGLEDWAREQYANLKVKADACVECGECEERCPYQLPIRELLKAAHELLA